MNDVLSRIDRTVELKASPERVYRALTTPAELAAWFHTDVEGEVKAGNVLWMVHEGQRFQVEIVELTPPERVIWRWYPGAVDPTIDYAKEPRTTVTFRLEPMEGGTRLHVSETGFDEISLTRRASVYKDNVQGWTEVVRWLAEYIDAATR